MVFMDALRFVPAFLYFFDLVAHGFLAGVRAMAVPLFTLECDFHAEIFALHCLPTQRDQQRLNVAKHDGR